MSEGKTKKPAVLVTPPPADALAPVRIPPPDFQESVHAVATFIPGATVLGMVPDGRLSEVTLYNLTVGESLEVADFLNTELPLLGWTARPSEPGEDDQGEARGQYVQVRLLTAHDQVIRSASRGIWESVVALTRIYGLGPWDPPVRVRPQGRALGNGRHWYYLFLLGR